MQNPTPDQIQTFVRRNPIQALVASLNRDDRRKYLRDYAKACAAYPAHLVQREVPEDMRGQVLATWQSNRFMATVWAPTNDSYFARISVNRVAIDNDGSWLEGITWDELQQVKNEVGFAQHTAVEVFPPRSDLVNVSNMRHLWVMNGALPFSLQ